MLSTPLLALGLAATALAQGTIPADYKKVYMTSMQDPKFVIVPKSATNGATTVVYVLQHSKFYAVILISSTARLLQAHPLNNGPSP